MTATAQPVRVEPAYHWAPPYDWTLGDEVGEFCRGVGYGPDPEQQPILNDIFAEDEDELPAIFSNVIVGPRRNIKTGVEIQAALGWLFVLEVPGVHYSAHKWKTSAGTLATMSEIIKNSDDLSRRMLPTMYGSGSAQLRTRTGQIMDFATRTLDGGRGEEHDKHIFDEALKLRDAHTSSLILTLATRPLAQVVYGSSACLADSYVLRDLVDRGRAGGDDSLSFTEFCAPPPDAVLDPATGETVCDRGLDCDHARTTKGCGLDKPRVIAMANPQYGRRIKPVFFANSRKELSPTGYCIEVLGWHAAAARKGRPMALDGEQFGLLEDGRSRASSVAAWGLDIDPQRTRASIAAAGPREDGLTHLELVTQVSVGEAVAECKRLDAKHGPATWLVDKGGQAGSLLEDLTDAGLAVEAIASVEMPQVCGRLVDATKGGTYRWRSHPQLEDAVSNARRRYRNKDFVFVGEDDQDITALYAAALAREGAEALNYDVTQSAW